MKIGIMGGTFNPIHNAHLLIAEMAREEYGLDRVIFITDGNPPHKSANVTAKQRFEMTHIAIADNSAFEEDDFEINRSEKSYTVNTLGYLKEKYPNNDLFFIIVKIRLMILISGTSPIKYLKCVRCLYFRENR